MAGEMFALDTSVLSDAMKSEPHPATKDPLYREGST
jgi:predicted nucleic acid-binding protein